MTVPVHRWPIALAALALAAGCASKPPREAIPQTSRVGEPPIVFAGSFDVEDNRLTLTANDEPIMRGSFLPVTPVLNMNGDYQGTPVRAQCYFGSRLSERGGLLGMVSSVVQSSEGKTADRCEMLVEGAEATTLNF